MFNPPVAFKRNGARLAVIEGGVINFIRADHISRPVFGTNTGGTKVWTAAYLPFGGVRTTTGTPINLRFPASGSNPNPACTKHRRNRK